MNAHASATVGVGDRRECGYCGSEFQRKRPLERYCSEQCHALAAETWARSLSSEQREFWRDLAPLVERALGAIDSLPERYALGVLRDIRSGNTRGIRNYFRVQFKREPERHLLAALYDILTRSDKWREPKGNDFPVAKYLRVAVWRRGQEFLVEWGLPSLTTDLKGVQQRLARRRWAEVRRRRAEESFAREASDEWKAVGTDDVDDDIVEMRQVLRSLALSSSQRDLMKLLEAGVPIPVAVEQLGRGWTVWQSLQRKARRALAKKNLGRVSSRGSDAA